METDTDAGIHDPQAKDIDNNPLEPFRKEFPWFWVRPLVERWDTVIIVDLYSGVRLENAKEKGHPLAYVATMPPYNIMLLSYLGILEAVERKQKAEALSLSEHIDATYLEDAVVFRAHLQVRKYGTPDLLAEKTAFHCQEREPDNAEVRRSYFRFWYEAGWRKAVRNVYDLLLSKEERQAMLDEAVAGKLTHILSPNNAKELVKRDNYRLSVKQWSLVMAIIRKLGIENPRPIASRMAFLVSGVKSLYHFRTKAQFQHFVETLETFPTKEHLYAFIYEKEKQCEKKITQTPQEESSEAESK